MKFIVAVDIEGVACAYGPHLSNVEDSFNISFVRRQAAREADSAVKALFDCGADDVIVWDCHGRGCSLDYDSMDERARFAIGATIGGRFPVIDGYDGVLLVGYHAMAGASDAVLCHTYSSGRYQSIKVCGEPVGEIALDAMTAGEHGVPVLFVSSDDKGAAEAKRVLPWVETCETKQSLACTRIVSKHPKRAAKDIYDGVCRAVRRMNTMRPYIVPTPLILEIRYTRVDDCRHASLIDMHGKPFGFADAYTRVGNLASCEDIFTRL